MAYEKAPGQAVYIEAQGQIIEFRLYDDGGANVYVRTKEQVRQFEAASENPDERSGGWLLWPREVNKLRKLLTSDKVAPALSRAEIALGEMRELLNTAENNVCMAHNNTYD